MRRIKGKLTDADRSGALLRWAHNPKVAGSNPARDLNPARHAVTESERAVDL
jgi:hypothetical protein